MGTEATRLWRLANPERHKANNLRWEAANREKRQQMSREYQLAHPKEVNESSRKWKEANSEKCRATAAKWRKENSERRRLAQSKRRAQKRNSFVEDVHPLVVLELDDGICGICNEDVDPFDFHVDHVIPLSLGGEHGYANVQVSHPKCNLSKGPRIV